MGADHSKNMLDRVRGRTRLAGYGSMFYLLLLVLAGVYLLLFVAARLLNLLPAGWADWTTLGAVPAVALIAAAFLHRRPNMRDAARLVDERMGTKDLYLTVATIDSAPGEYKPLVVDAAESQAPRIRPQTVVPYDPWPKTGQALAAMGVLAVLVMSPLNFDPFGFNEQREQLAKQQEELKKQTEDAADRAKRLEDKKVSAKRSKATESAVENMKLSLNKMKPNKSGENLRKLVELQKQLERQHLDKLNKQQRDRTAAALTKRSTAQRLGGGQSDSKMKKLAKEFAAGKTDGLKKELEKLKEMADELAKTKDPAKQAQLRKKMEEGLKDISELLNQQGGSQQLQQALSQALSQLDMSGMEGLSQQALQSLQQSLQLSQLELDALSQNLSDMQALEQAMQLLQQAKMLNNMEPLDGGQCGSCKSMADYAALYAQMISQCQGQGSGGGMSGPGQGQGNIAPEDPGQVTKFKDEKARTHMTEGKILMQWKTEEMGPKGQVKENYRQTVRRIKQRVSEAINNEEVPPGYHGSIKKYFERIDESGTAAADDTAETSSE